MTPAPRDPVAGIPPVSRHGARDGSPGRPGRPSPAHPVAGEGPSPSQGRTRTPAGGARASSSQATSAPPAGSTGRTYTIALPAGLKLLSLNDRLHWSERARRTEALKKAAWAVTLQAKVPPLERAAVIVEYQPPDRRRRDAENTCAASGKAAVDGVVAAGVLPDDECPRYVSEIACTIGEPCPKGRLVLHLIEVAAGGGAA